MQHRFASSIVLKGALLALFGLLVCLLAWQSLRAAAAAPLVTLDGVRDGSYGAAATTDPAADLANPGPGSWNGTTWSDLTALYCQRDATHLYVYVDLPAYAQNTSSGQIGLVLNTRTGGGSSDPWGNAITYNHANRPDYLVRGNIPGISGNAPNDNNGWTELRSWSGSAWSAGGTNWGGISSGGQTGNNIAYANGQGVELRLAFADLGIANDASVGLQFFATQAGGSKGAYDTLPSDDQSTGWDDATTLTQYATCAATVPPTHTPTSTPTSTATATPTSTPTNTPVPTNTPTATATPSPTPVTPVPPDGVLVYSDLHSVAPGQSVTVYVEVENTTVSQVGAANIDVRYDPAVVTLSSCSVDPDNSFDSGLCNPAFAADTAKFNILSLSGVTSDARLVALTFDAIGAIGDSSPIDISINVLTDHNGAAMTGQVLDGRIDIIGASTTVIRTGSYSTTPGGTRGVLIGGVNLPAGLQTIDLTLLYDPAIVRPTGCADHPGDGYTLVSCDIAYENNLYNPDAVRMVLEGAARAPLSTANLATVTFETVGSPYQSSPLSLTLNALTGAGGQPLSGLTQDGRMLVDNSVPTAVTLRQPAAPGGGTWLPLLGLLGLLAALLLSITRRGRRAR